MNLLIKNALTQLPEGFKKADIYIQDGRIASIDCAPENYVPQQILDGTGKLALPGMVNAHTHAYMTPMRNWADDLPFNVWLFDKVSPVEDRMTAQDAYWGALAACMEMVRSGCTSFLDMHMFPCAGIRAAQELGMYSVVSRGLTGSAEDPQNSDRRLREAEEELEAYKDDPNVGFMLGPHAPYTSDEAYLVRIAQRAGELGIGLNTHLSESVWEVQEIRNRYGCTPTEFYDRCGILTPRTVVAHCVHLTEHDMDLLAERGVSIALNHVSNLKLANGIPPVPALMKRGINLCLGTDSAASNNSLSVLREMQFAALLHKGTTGDPCAVSAGEALKMATENGARALGMEGQLGRIAPGYRADIALFDLEQPGLLPLGDPAAALCYSSVGMQAETVMINGRVVLKDGEFASVDTARVRYEIQAICERLGMN